MIENAFFVPLLPGKSDAARFFAQTMSGPRRAELDQAQTTVTKESWFLQQTPLGDFLIVYYVSPNPKEVHEALAISQEPFDVWFREQVLELTGIDISTPLPGLPEQILAWSKA